MVFTEKRKHLYQQIILIVLLSLPASVDNIYCDREDDTAVVNSERKVTSSLYIHHEQYHS